jgi:transketolase
MTPRVLSGRIRRTALEPSKRAGLGHIGSWPLVAERLAVLVGGVLRARSHGSHDIWQGCFLHGGRNPLALPANVRSAVRAEALQTREQPAVSLLLHALPVRIDGVGAGLDCGHNGITHYALEDVGVMRAQPELAIVAPADPAQARRAVHACSILSGPAYMRIDTAGAEVPEPEGRFELGHAQPLGEGRDLAIIALSSIASEAVETTELLRERPSMVFMTCRRARWQHR